MVLLFGALIAGVLTTLAPCVLPLLPVIVGGSLAGSSTASPTRRALIITGSLGASVIAFSLLLKATTALIDVPFTVWTAVSGGLLIVLGLIGLFPTLWDRFTGLVGLQGRTTSALSGARERSGLLGLVLTGAALGPVFSSCSPLYAYVVVTLLPAEPVFGVFLLLAYALGLCGTLLAVALLGQRVISRVGWAVDPHGLFRRILGAVFLIVGILVATGLMRTVESWILQNSPIAPWALDGGFIPPA